MNNNYAVIDIGTLKVKLYIASFSEEGKLQEIYSSNNLTCFGCDMDKNGGNILEKNIKKTISELRRCKKMLQKYKVIKYKVISTHAMRRAKNKEKIIEKIKKEVGFDVKNITQQNEAKTFFNAVLRDFPKEKEYVVLDIGGGSVQIMIGNQNKLKHIHMMQTGAQYLHNNFTKDSGNPKAKTFTADIGRMEKYILSQLSSLEKTKNLPVIYGSTNIIDLMKTIKIPLESHSDSNNHPFKTHPKYLKDFIKKMLPLPYHKREKMFNFQWGYMWGVDKAFLNVVIISKYLKSPYIIPSNENIAKGFIYEMQKKI